MWTKERLKSIGLKCLILSAIIVLIWLVVVLCIRVFTHSKEPFVPLVYGDGYLFVPEGSPLRSFIKTHVVVKAMQSIPFTLPGVVEPIPTKLVKVVPPLLGRIVTIRKEAGDSVTRGEILFTINSPDLAQAINDVEKAKSARVLANQTLIRQQKLLAANIGSLHDLQQAQNDFDQASSNLLPANARLNVLNVEKYESGTEEGTLIVRSPLSGYVLDVNAGIGEYWSDANAPIMTVADLSSVYVTINAQEKDLNEIYIGQNVQVTLDAYLQPYQSTIDSISYVLDPDTRTIPVNTTLDNKKGALRPNMFANAVLMTRPRNRISVPLSSVIQRGFDSIVFVEVSPWKFKPQVVEVGPQFADSIEILSGLSANERIVLTGGIILNAGVILND